MTFASFIEVYIADTKKRVRLNTWKTKEHILRTKILPYFKDRKLDEIQYDLLKDIHIQAARGHADIDIIQ